MDRREFIAAGIAGTLGSALTPTEAFAQPVGTESPNRVDEQLFSTNVKTLEWAQFAVSGFTQPVCGIVHRKNRQAECGVPLGAINIRMERHHGFSVGSRRNLPLRALKWQCQVEGIKQPRTAYLTSTWSTSTGYARRIMIFSGNSILLSNKTRRTRWT